MFPKLFIRDSKGNQREWLVKVLGNQVIVEHGQSGKKITQKITKSKPKNIGKVNETTDEEQAIKDAQSKWNTQVERKDYHENIELSGCQIRPELALDYLKVPHRVQWDEAIGMPKLDGLRLVIGNRFRPSDSRFTNDIEMMTREGDVYHVKHLHKPSIDLLNIINAILPDGKYCLALDGEAYKHGLKLQQINSLCRKHQPKTEEIEYHLFDLIIEDLMQEHRYGILNKAIEIYNETYGDNNFKIVPEIDITKDNINDIQGKLMSDGYEGLMIRHKDSFYGIGQRSPNLFKYKQFFDTEFQIFDIKTDVDGNGVFWCRSQIGQIVADLAGDHEYDTVVEFKATPKRTHDEKRYIAENPCMFIGKWVTVKYQGLTPEFKPQFPVALDLRECDDSGHPII